MPNKVVGTGKNSPTGVTSSSFGFVYNASHERAKETLPDGTVVYNLSPRVDTGIHEEIRVSTNGTITYMSSLYAGSMPFGADNTSVTSANVKTQTTTYYHTDHLGSIIALSDQSGNVTERRSYDAWGKRRNLNGTSMNNAFVTPVERHGFAGQEELDDVGLIHMNGRLYDPAVGRFVSADPTVQYASEMQNYNRYSYIDNNPLSAVDMSGFGFLDDFVGDIFDAIGSVVGGAVDAVKAALSVPLIRTIATIAVAAEAPGWGNTLFGFEVKGLADSVFSGFVSSLVAGRGDLGAALRGALTAGAMNLVGAEVPDKFENTVAHGVVGCGSSVMSGGNCGSGALAGGFSAAAANSGLINNNLNAFEGALASAVIGGTASVLGGGKFENGAMTGAFGYLYNFLVHVWEPSIVNGKFQVGHVMITSDDGSVIESQFPDSHFIVGNNTTYSQSETYGSEGEGRVEDHLYHVDENSQNSRVGASIGAVDRSKPYWAFLPVPTLTTNCSAAAADVLSAVNSSFRFVNTLIGDIPTPWSINSELNLLSSMPGTGVEKLK